MTATTRIYRLLLIAACVCACVTADASAQAPTGPVIPVIPDVPTVPVIPPVDAPAPVPSAAPGPGPFKPQAGQPVEYRDRQVYPPVWRLGTALRQSYGSEDWVVLAPTPFDPLYERTYSLVDLRAPQPTPATTPTPAGAPTPDVAPMPTPNAAPAPAPGPFKPQAGQPVEYRDRQVYPPVWRLGTALRQSYGADTWVILAPTPFDPLYERTYSLEDLRAPQPKPQQELEFASCGDGGAESGSGPGSDQAPQATSAPMSQDDVLSFLRARFGPGDPFANPQKDQILDQLRGEVLRRGLAFRYETLGAFSNELAKFGAVSNVRAPMAENFGAPSRIQDLSGRWQLLKVGVAVEYDKGAYRYTRPEWVGPSGALVINADRTYVWYSPSGDFKGSWRPATPEEMAKSDKGGEGVVILRAKSNADWLVFKRDEGGPEGIGIKIVDLETRNLRERGTR